jgi:hypothetical protein
MRSAFGQQVMAKVFEFNPDYSQANWQAKVRGEVAFTAGKEAGAIRSFSVAIDHLNTMEEAGEALATTDIQALNALRNRVITEFGYAGPVDFNFVKSIVGSEVSKAIIGGVGALTDREELRVNLDNANSPEQLLRVITFAKKLMAGQLSGYRLQAKNIGMTDEEFDRHLSAAAKAELGGLRAGETAPPVPPGYPPSFATDPEGTKYRRPEDGARFIKKGGELTPTVLGESSTLGLPRMQDIGRWVLGGPVVKGQWEVQRP